MASDNTMCPHGKESKLACDVCSGRGVWAGVEDVPIEDVLECMRGEFDDEEPEHSGKGRTSDE